MHPFLGRSVRANAAFFLASGVGIGAWAASLPGLSASKALSSGELGLVLFCFAFGAILTMTNVGRWVPVLGTARISLAGSTLFGLSLALAPHTGHPVALGAVVALAGASFGSVDVAINTEAALVERGLSRPLMSSLHAVFSVGNLLGAVAVGWLLGEGVGIATCLGAAGLLVVGISVAGRLSGQSGAGAPQRPENPKSAPREAPGERRGAGIAARTYQVGVLAFVALFCEGALLDWIAIYLVQIRGVAESTAAFGFAVFAASIAVGRFAGDAAARRLGPPALLGLGAATVSLSIVAALLSPVLPVVFVALAAAGLGMANAVPVIFSAAGRIGGTAGVSMSRVVSIGYAGLLVGPPFVGGIAEFISLQASLGFVAAFMLAIVIGRKMAAA